MVDFKENEEGAIENHNPNGSEIIDASDKDNIPSDKDVPIEQLSRHERKKLKKQEFKEYQQLSQKQHQKKRILKNLMMYGTLALIIIGIIILFVNSGKVKWPTVDDDPFIGPIDAPITIIEFGDFQCPFTRNFNTGAFKDLMKENDGKIKWVFKDMITGRHLNSKEASMAVNCAGDQGKFIEYHDLLFKRVAADVSSLKSYAKELSLDTGKFDECYDSKKYADEIKQDYKQGKDAGVTITPTFYIIDKKNNIVKMQGDLPASAFKPLLDKMLSEV